MDNTISNSLNIEQWRAIFNAFTRNNSSILLLHMGYYLIPTMLAAVDTPVVNEWCMKWNVCIGGTHHMIECTFTLPLTVRLSKDGVAHGPQLITTVSGHMYVDKYVDGIRDGIQQIYNCKNVKTLEFRYCRGYGPYNIKQWITVPYLNSYTVLERLLALGGVFQVDDGYPSKMGNGHNILIQADNLTNSTLYFSLANTAKNLSRLGTCDIKRGALNGVFKWYNRGVMVSVGTVVDGFTVGPWYRWSQTGVVKSGEMPKSANF